MLMIVPTINSYISSESMLGLGDIGSYSVCMYISMYMYTTIDSYLSSEFMFGLGDININLIYLFEYPFISVFINIRRFKLV